MTWTNAFDVGECTVKVFGQYDMTTMLFSQIMAKGDSATYMDDVLGEATVAVDATGAVSLSAADAADIAQSGGGPQWTLCVTPTAPPATACRIRDMYCDVPVYGTYAATTFGDLTASGVALEDAGNGLWTPDPCDLPDAVEFALQGIGMAA